MNRAFTEALLSAVVVLGMAGEALAWRGPGRGGPGPGPGPGPGGRPGGGMAGPGSLGVGSGGPGPGRVGVGPGTAGALGSGGPGVRSPVAGGRVKPEALEGFLGNREASANAGSRGQAIQNWSGQAYKPFTPAWYAQHPAAWQATHPHADAWVAATAVGVAAWLAVPYASVSGGTTYVTETPTEAAATATAIATATATTPETTSNAPTSENLTGLDATGQWLCLGVFAVGPKGEKETNRVVQLAVNKDGKVQGAYVDTVTGTEENITGAVDKKTVQIRWQIGVKGIAFDSALSEYTKPQGNVTATLPGGKTAAWQVSQVKK